MKKILSICLVLVMMLSVFAVPVSAESGLVVFSGYYDGQYNDLLFTVDEYDMTATIVGYVLRDSNSPGGSKAIPTSVVYKNKYYEVIGIDDLAFYQSMYTKISVPSTVTYIGSNAFASSLYLEDVEIDENCELYYVGSSLFMGTPYEAEIYENKATYLGKNVLYKYNGDGEFTIPDNITIIAPQAFMWSDVEKVVFNNNIEEIPFYCFSSCWSLTDVVFSDSINYVAEGAFADCSSLENITLGNNVWSLGLDSFSGTAIKSIHLGASVDSIAGAFRNCSALETITVDRSNTVLFVNNNVVYTYANFPTIDKYGNIDFVEGKVVAYSNPKYTSGKITVQSDVMAIGDYAYYGCKDLESVSANELMMIGTGAFQNSGIKEFNAKGILNTGVYVIDNDAFADCKNLTKINLANVTVIGDSAFENCTALADVVLSENMMYLGDKAFANTGIVEITIKNCDIGEGTFMNCKKLEKVTIGEGVTAIFKNAFLGCPNLKVISISKDTEYFDENAFNGCDDVTFELIKGTKAYKFIKRNTDFNIEVVGSYSFFQRIVDFFRSIFG